MSIVLSISLLVCGRKETRQCLESLQPIREQLPCELILVDTGCDQETRKIIEEYADKIIPFTWCNDFSKARNAGLKAATGEWFLYLDDDEWFVNPQELITFFQSGEYRNYESACYVVRNFFDYEEHTWEDIQVSRLVRRLPETRFVNPIHEYLSPCKAPVKLLKTYVKHFGYIYGSEEEKLHHAMRNINLLEKARLEQPKEVRWAAQLTVEYFNVEQYEKAIKLAKAGLKQFYDAPVRYRGLFYGMIVRMYRIQKKTEQAERYIKEGLADTGTPELGKSYLYLESVRLYYAEGKDAECLEAAEKYEKGKPSGQEKEHVIYEQGLSITAGTYRQENQREVLAYGIMAAFRAGQMERMAKYLDRFEIVPEDFWMLQLLKLHRMEQNGKLEQLTYFQLEDCLEGLALAMRRDEEEMSEAGLLQETIQCRQTGKEKAFLENVKTLMQKYPEMASLLQKYIKAKPDMDAELLQLAGQLRKQAKTFLEQGQPEAAAQILTQLVQVFPKNQEFPALLQQAQRAEKEL